MKKSSSEDKLIIGRKPVLDCLNSNTEIEKVWISKTLKGDIEKEIRALTRQKTIPLQYVPKEKITSLTRNKNHQGVAAQLSLVNYMSIEEVIPYIYEQARTPAFLVLDSIEDVRNIGALVRSAVWFDFDAVVVTAKKSARLNSFAYKASAGSLKDMIICREASITKALEYLKSSGIKIVVSSLKEATSGSKIDFNEPVAIVLGSEGKGVSKEVSALADAHISIPGSHKVDSLNVSVAGAILMHNLYQQRNN